MQSAAIGQSQVRVLDTQTERANVRYVQCGKKTYKIEIKAAKGKLKKLSNKDWEQVAEKLNVILVDKQGKKKWDFESAHLDDHQVIKNKKAKGGQLTKPKKRTYSKDPDKGEKYRELCQLVLKGPSASKKAMHASHVKVEQNDADTSAILLENDHLRKGMMEMKEKVAKKKDKIQGQKEIIRNREEGMDELQEKMGELEMLVQNFRSQLEAEKSRNDQLVERNLVLEEGVKKNKGKVAKFKEQDASQRDALKQGEKELELQAASFDKAQSELITQKKHLQEQLDGEKDAKAKLASELKAAREKIDGLQDELLGVTQSSKSYLSQLEARIKENEELKRKLTAKKAKYKGSGAELSAALEKANKKSLELEAQLAELQGANKELVLQRELEVEKKDHSKDLGRLEKVKTKQHAAEKGVEELKEKLQGLEVELQRLQSEEKNYLASKKVAAKREQVLKKAQKENRKLKKDLEGLRGEFKGADQKLQVEAGKLASAEEALKEKEAELKKVVDSKKDLKQKLEKKISQNGAKIGSLTEELQTKSKELLDKAALLEKQNRTLEKKTSEYNNLKKDAEKFEKDYEAQTVVITDLENQKEKLERSNEYSKRQVQELQAEVDSVNKLRAKEKKRSEKQIKVERERHKADVEEAYADAKKILAEGGIAAVSSDELGRAKAKISDLESAQAKLREMLVGADSKSKEPLEDLVQKIREEEKAFVEKKEQEVADLTEQLGLREKHLTTYENHVRKLKAEIKERDKLLQELSGKIAKATIKKDTQIKEADEVIQTAEERMDKLKAEDKKIDKEFAEEKARYEKEREVLGAGHEKLGDAPMISEGDLQAEKEREKRLAELLKGDKPSPKARARLEKDKKYQDLRTQQKEMENRIKEGLAKLKEGLKGTTDEETEVMNKLLADETVLRQQWVDYADDQERLLDKAKGQQEFLATEVEKKKLELSALQNEVQSLKKDKAALENALPKDEGGVTSDSESGDEFEVVQDEKVLSEKEFEAKLKRLDEEAKKETDKEVKESLEKYDKAIEERHEARKDEKARRLKEMMSKYGMPKDDKKAS